jgi:hypothetical protein
MHIRTQKHLEDLERFFIAFRETNGDDPTAAEVQRHLNLRSPSHASYFMKLLKASGRLQDRPRDSGATLSSNPLKDALQTYLAGKTVVAIKIGSSLFCVDKDSVLNAIFEA